MFDWLASLFSRVEKYELDARGILGRWLMTGFTLDWASVRLDEMNVLTALGETIKIEVLAGGMKDAFLVRRNESQPALIADLHRGPLKIALRFQDTVGGVSFRLLAASQDGPIGSSVPAEGVAVVARDRNGHDVPVLCSMQGSNSDHGPVSKASGIINVTIPGPIASLTLSFDLPHDAETSGLVGVSNMTFDLVAPEEADDSEFDILNLIGADVDFITFDASAPEDGVVAFTNGQTIAFSEIDRVVPCFTPGTAIATPNGEVAVEKLKTGDRILTRDNGIQTINWVGTKRLDFAALKAAPQLRPIKIKAGALGDNMPERDMLVSPSHRMLIVSHQAELYFSQSEILVAAQHMLAMDGVEVSEQPYITYIHIMCENHEIVLSDGAWSESFQPADFTLKGFDVEQREELFALFPQLETTEGVAAYGAARRTLSRREAKLLFKG